MPTDVWAKADGTSSEEEEESDDESGAPAATTQEAKSQVLQEIKQVTHQSEAVAAPAQSAEKSEQEKRALEERQRLLEAQKSAQAAQAAAMQQAAASRQAQQAGDDERAQAAKRQQEEALKKAQEAQQKAQAEAKARQEAALKQAQEAQAKAQSEAKARQEAAQKQAQEAQAKAQADAKARQEAAQKQAQEAQAKAQADAQARAAQAKAQADALAAQRQAAQQQKAAAQQQKAASQQQAQPQQQQQQQQLGKAPAVKTQELNLGSQATSHAVKQPLKEPGKLAAPVPAKPDAPKEAAQLPGNTALRQTAKAQESSMSDAPLHPVHTAALAGVNAQKPQVKQAGVEERFAEKEEVAQMTLERGPAGIRLQDDTCWQTQKRVAPEIDVPAVGKVTIPEFSDDHEVMRTIVAQPAGFQKVAWNEFPEEKQVERIQAPRVKAQEWKPVNQEEMEVLRTNYNPGRVSAVWPPPQEEIVKDNGAVTRVRVGDDLGWIQQEQHEVPRFPSRTSRINRAWPPPEHEVQTQDVHTSHLGPVVWPPPEFEEKEKEAVDSLHNTLPVGHIDRQWPPAAPEYTMVPQRSPVVDTQHGPQEISETVVTTTQVVRQPMAAK
ncbi:unnamed protein product, partial [Mesorhabditis spiculigera]